MTDSSTHRPALAQRQGHSVPLADWEAVVRVFHDLFADLGEVTHDDAGISFSSRPPDVVTGLSLRKDGRIQASMPLHGLEAIIDRLRWDETRSWLELVGQGVSYTYRIPAELLKHRGNAT